MENLEKEGTPMPITGRAACAELLQQLLVSPAAKQAALQILKNLTTFLAAITGTCCLKKLSLTFQASLRHSCFGPLA